MTTSPSGQGWGDRPLSQIFDYVFPSSGSPKLPPDVQPQEQQKLDMDMFHSLPRAAALDTASIIGSLDPTLTHFGVGPSVPDVTIVADSDPLAGVAVNRVLSADWRAAGATPWTTSSGPVASLSIGFLADTGMLDPGGMSVRNGPCPMGNFDAELVAEARAAWGRCTTTKLADGSVVSVASAAFGAGTEIFAVRAYPDDRGAIVLTAGDFRAVVLRHPGPADVFKPSPWSEAKLTATLSDPALVPGLPTDAITSQPAGFLKPADLGTGFTFDVAGSHASTSELQLMNGCTPDRSVFNLQRGRMAQYDGTVPDGTAVVVDEGEYLLPHGTGKATFAMARQMGQGGCGAPNADYSQDTVSLLPGGIGDGAFVENQVGEQTVRILIRFGDTVVDTQVRAADTTHPVDLSSTADRAWLTGVARQIAACWTSKG